MLCNCLGSVTFFSFSDSIDLFCYDAMSLDTNQHHSVILHFAQQYWCFSFYYNNQDIMTHQLDYRCQYVNIMTWVCGPALPKFRKPSIPWSSKTSLHQIASHVTVMLVLMAACYNSVLRWRENKLTLADGITFMIMPEGLSFPLALPSYFRRLIICYQLIHFHRKLREYRIKFASS